MTAIKPRTTTVVIYQGDDLQRLAALDADVERTEVRLRQAERAAKTTAAAPLLMHEVPATDPVAQATVDFDAARDTRDAFAADAEARGVTVVLSALPRRDWRSLTEAHPARDGNEGDKQFGVNMEAFPDALLPASVNREQSTIEGDTVEFLESLSDYDYYDRLFLSAFALNRGSAVADPTLRLA